MLKPSVANEKTSGVSTGVVPHHNLLVLLIPLDFVVVLAEENENSRGPDPNTFEVV